MSESPQESGAPPGRPRGPHGPMSLFLRLMAEPLDGGYAQAAARRAGTARTPAHRRSVRLLLFAALLCIGLFASVAVAHARQQPITNDQRDKLVTHIHDQTARSDKLQDKLARLRARTERARSARLAKSERGRQAEDRLRRLRTAVGAVPVRGPGLTVRIANKPLAEGVSGASDIPPSVRLRDDDVRMLVNALWSAGAEAVAVNGSRITSLTAIRSAGEAILVNYRPINPPYTVSAIGDPDELRSGLAGSEAGRLFHTLHANYRMGFDVRKRGYLRLPGASGASLRYARKAGDE